MSEDEKFIRELISKIIINKPNIDHIAEYGKINGSLMLDILAMFPKYKTWLIEQGEVHSNEAYRQLESEYIQLNLDHMDLLLSEKPTDTNVTDSDTTK